MAALIPNHILELDGESLVPELLGPLGIVLG
jgi:hypothetical protein